MMITTSIEIMNDYCEITIIRYKKETFIVVFIINNWYDMLKITFIVGKIINNCYVMLTIIFYCVIILQTLLNNHNLNLASYESQNIAIHLTGIIGAGI